MSTDIRDRLRRLGVHKGTAHLKPSAAKQAELERERQGLRPERDAAPRDEDFISPADVAAQYDSRQSNPTLNDEVEAPIESCQLTHIETPYGIASFRRVSYALDHTHGDRLLLQALQSAPDLIGRLAGRTIEQFDISDALFIDTETTGLAGGAGTLAFVVGVGYFEKDEVRGMKDEADNPPSSFIPHPSSFIIDQFFLRDPADEVAMLYQIDQLLNSHQHLVTFNGRGFDVPLLETRFTLSRIPPTFGDKLHLDLLMPARRFWRGMLSSCSLSSLEYHLLGVQRDQHDIAGFLIPQLYREWLAENTSELNPDMQRVMYHNLHDILSMVTLSARLSEALAHPHHPSEHIAIGREHERAGAWAQAEQVYRAAVKATAEQIATEDVKLIRRLANALKRQGKAEEALPHWRTLADRNDLDALLELAKYFEWQGNNLDGALFYTRLALDLSQSPYIRDALTHRLARLENKKRRAQELASTNQTSS